MLKDSLSIEDLILFLSGTKEIAPDVPYPVLKGSDYNLIYSFAKQINRKMGFTDRQYELAKAKIDDYADLFHFVSDLEIVKATTKFPLRDIDRSRWIKIEYRDNQPIIAVRFTFQKKLISSLEKIQSNIRERADYDKVNKIHYFAYSEKNLFDIVESFKENNFDLDDTVKEIYEKIKTFNPNDHIPGVYNYEIKNLHPAGVELLSNELGKPSKDNILLYKDRAYKYGLNIVDGVVKEDTLEYKIAHRQHLNVSVDESKHSIDQILLALENLKRYPLLILVPEETCYDVIVQVQQHVRNLIKPEETSVVFRLDNQGEGLEFNQYIKDQRINNKVDNNTKIVYSLDNKIPKPLLQSSWFPKSIVVVGVARGFTNTRKVLDCYSDSDLILYYGNSLGPGHTHYYRREFDKI